MKKCSKCGTEYKDGTTLCPLDGSVLLNESNGLVGRTLAAKYRVDEVISEGGMGTVYRGTHILMDKTVAIKVLRPSLAADNIIVARFSREARAASRISHPHAISVTDFGESEDGIVFLVMEFLHGKTLKEVVRNDGPMSLTRAVEIMRQVCGALEAAHMEGVVHRDLKSDNIMLLDVADGDWVKVLDFGIAKVQEPGGLDPGLTAPDLIIGTPQYMSPEQCSQASEIDARSDIYSLGVILFEMLAGHVPFTGESPTTVMLKHLQEPPPNLLSERPDLSFAIGSIVDRALAKRPEDRFQTVKELRKSLALAAEMPVDEHQSSNDEFMRSERRTNRIVVSTSSDFERVDRDDDEITVVHPSPMGAIEAPYRAVKTGPPSKRKEMNPWLLAVISLLGVLVIGGILYAMMRNKPVDPSTQTPPLTADPNSRPVKPVSPPTGQAERDIVPTLPANANVDANANSTDANSNQNQNSELPVGNDNINGNSNAKPEVNTPGANPSPGSSTNSNKNGPSTQKTAPPKVDVGPPPPMPSPKTDQ